MIYDENGEQVPKGSGKAGNICIRNPWPGSFLTIWGQPERYVETYYAKYNRDKDSKDWHDWPYFAGDGAVDAADGYFRILGRIDDVINVAGHRLGTKEIESASITVDEIAEAAAVPVIDDVRGKVVEVYVALKPGVSPARSSGAPWMIGGDSRSRFRPEQGFWSSERRVEVACASAAGLWTARWAPCPAIVGTADACSSGQGWPRLRAGASG